MFEQDFALFAGEYKFQNNEKHHISELTKLLRYGLA